MGQRRRGDGQFSGSHQDVDRSEVAEAASIRRHDVRSAAGAVHPRRKAAGPATRNTARQTASARRRAGSSARDAARQRAVLARSGAGLRNRGRSGRLLSTPALVRAAAGATLRRPALSAIAPGRGHLRVPAGNRSPRAPAFQRAGATGGRSRTGQDHRSVPDSEGVLDSRPGAQGDGALAAFAGVAMEGRAHRKVQPAPRVARYRGVPPRRRPLLEGRAAGGGLHRHGAHGRPRRRHRRRPVGHGDRGRSPLPEESHQRELAPGGLAAKEVHPDADGHSGGK